MLLLTAAGTTSCVQQMFIAANQEHVDLFDLNHIFIILLTFKQLLFYLVAPLALVT